MYLRGDDFFAEEAASRARGYRLGLLGAGLLEVLWSGGEVGECGGEGGEGTVE